jgi:hypothetical protein
MQDKIQKLAMKSAVLFVVSKSETTRHFGAIYRHHFQGRDECVEMSVPTDSANFLPGLIFELRSGGYEFHRNVGLCRNYIALQPLNRYFPCEII